MRSLGFLNAFMILQQMAIYKISFYLLCVRERIWWKASWGRECMQYRYIFHIYFTFLSISFSDTYTYTRCITVFECITPNAFQSCSAKCAKVHPDVCFQDHHSWTQNGKRRLAWDLHSDHWILKRYTLQISSLGRKTLVGVHIPPFQTPLSPPPLTITKQGDLHELNLSKQARTNTAC